MKKIIEIYNQIEEKFCTYTFLIVIILIFYQVVGRYVLGNAPTWSEELSRYLYVWECWLGVSLTQRDHRHIQLTFLLDILPKPMRKLSDCVAFIITVGTAVILAYYGFQLVLFAANQGNISPSLHLPMWIFYLCLPVGCVAFILRKFGEIVTLVKVNKQMKQQDEGGEA